MSKWEAASFVVSWGSKFLECFLRRRHIVVPLHIPLHTVCYFTVHAAACLLLFHATRCFMSTLLHAAHCFMLHTASCYTLLHVMYRFPSRTAGCYMPLHVRHCP